MTFDVVQYSRKLSVLVESATPFVTVTLLSIRGSAPQIAGAKAIVTAQGIVSGTIGGGKIEGVAIEHACTLLSAEDGKSSEVVKWNLQTDIGMTCGGEVQIFFEVHRQADWPITVFGAGHVSQALVPMLMQLHCRVTCIDPRIEWMEKLPDHPKLTKHCVAEPKGLVGEQPEKSFFLLMSKGHSADVPVLAEILKTREPPYIGMIGSEQKAKVVRRELEQMGINEEKRRSFYCPIGLPIGNNTPAEISISVIAQIISQRDELGILAHKVKSFREAES